MNEIPSGSASYKAKNPHLFGVGGLPAPKRESRSVETLERESQGTETSRGSVDECPPPKPRICLIAHRRRIIDSANLVASFKGLQDAIAAWLVVDDSDIGIDWEYSQVRTNGRQGVIVKFDI